MQATPLTALQGIGHSGVGEGQSQIPPIFVQQLSLQQLQHLSHLNYLKETVPCIEYLYGFCVDGAKECMFYHPKPKFKNGEEGKPYLKSKELDSPPMPQYLPNECLPKEYLDKVKNYFDDSQITNVNMIQSLMRQVAVGQTMARPGSFFPEGNAAPADTFDLHSLMGGMNLNSQYGRPMDSMTNYSQPMVGSVAE